MRVRRGVGVAATAASATAALLLLLPGAAAPSRYGSRVSLTLFEVSLVDAINATRVEHGLAPLGVDARLTGAATAHSHQMVTDGYFSHRTPTGVGFVQRLEYYYPVGRSSNYGVAENLYWGSSRRTASAVVARWMKSPDHRANLLSPDWRQVGVGAISVPSAPGVYRGLPVTVVTVDFGVRR